MTYTKEVSAGQQGYISSSAPSGATGLVSLRPGSSVSLCLGGHLVGEEEQSSADAQNPFGRLLKIPLQSVENLLS